MAATFDETPVPDYLARCRLPEQVVLVIGAGQGIGRQTAHALAQAGAHVICVGRSQPATERIAQEVGGTPFVGDAQRRDDVEQLFDLIESKFGRLHAIVDVPAIGIQATALNVSREDWVWQYDNILSHALLTVQMGGPMIARTGGGAITFVGSVMGHAVMEGLDSVGYGTAKAALNQLARIAAVELGPSGVRVNVVSPGLVMTPRYQSQSPQWLEAAAKSYPLRRPAEASEVASAILFMTSELASDITGQVLVVDGGLTTLSPPAVPVGFTAWDKSMYEVGAGVAPFKGSD